MDEESSKMSLSVNEYLKKYSGYQSDPAPATEKESISTIWRHKNRIKTLAFALPAENIIEFKNIAEHYGVSQTELFLLMLSNWKQ
ncbi:MAG: hypothetical protein QXL94_00310 [Candidatus Parvarchaeum sp.]